LNSGNSRNSGPCLSFLLSVSLILSVSCIDIGDHRWLAFLLEQCVVKTSRYRSLQEGPRISVSIGFMAYVIYEEKRLDYPSCHES
jgi:hypothetical protein